MGLPLLAAERLRKTYGPLTVVDIERLEVFEGEVFALLGPNGAGKSTLLRLLAMLERPSGGLVTYRGHVGARAERALRTGAAIVLQRPHFWRESVAYNVGLGLRLRGVSRAEADRRVTAACGAFGLADLAGSPVTTLSRGQRRRVSLARALVLEPALLFLDEPAAGLDAEARAALDRDLAGLARDRSTTIVLATHERNEAFQLADRVAVLRDGTIRQTGTPADVYADPRDAYASHPTGARLALSGRVESVRGRTLVVDTGGASLVAVGEAAPGEAVRVLYRPEDLLLTRAKPTAGGVSARNLMYATVGGLRDEDGLVRVRLHGPVEVLALVTRAAADSLGLEPGLRVAVRVKASALRAVGTGGPAVPGRRSVGPGDGAPATPVEPGVARDTPEAASRAAP